MALCFQNGLSLAGAINTCGSADTFYDEEQTFVDREILQQGCVHKLGEHEISGMRESDGAILELQVVEHVELPRKEAIQSPA